MQVRLIALLLLLLLLDGGVGCRADAQDTEWLSRALQTDDGLPDNTINGVAQSSDGYLWVATNGGAMRFNGNRFSPISLSSLPNLPSRAIQVMFLDRAGQLWLALTRGPVVRIGRDSYHAFDAEDGLFERRVIGITDDAQGRVWIAYTNGVCRIEGDQLTRISDSGQRPMGGHGSLICDAGGTVWLSLGGTLSRLTDEGLEPARFFEGRTPALAAGREGGVWLALDDRLLWMDANEEISEVASLPGVTGSRAVFEDEEGAVWVGTENDGLLRVKDEEVTRVETSHRWVTCIMGDQEGNIWAGTRGGGLNLIRPRIADFIESVSLASPLVLSTACDAEGRVWAVDEGGGLSYRENGEWHPEERVVARATCVTTDPSGRVWVGTMGQGVLMLEGDQLRHYGHGDGLSGGVVRAMFAAANGDLWVATDGPDRLHRLRDGEVTVVEHEGQLELMRAIAEGADGSIWVGSSDGRLFQVRGERLVDVSDLDGPLQLSIRSLHGSADGSLWIGYAGNGLGRIKDGSYIRYTTEEGLYDDYISQIEDDGMGSLWIAANRGLFQVDVAELEALAKEPGSGKLACRVYGRNDGVPSIQPSRNNTPTSCRGPDGRLYFPTHNGVIEARPDKVRTHTLPPPVVIERAVVDNQLLAIYRPRYMPAPGESGEGIDLSVENPDVEIPRDHDRLVINVAALSLSSPENVSLRYRLSPIDERWEEIENLHSVSFSRLPAGRYEFQVIAGNNVGVWNREGATLGILVRPYFWETWWFKLGGGLMTAALAGGLVFLGLRRRHRLQLQRISAKQALEQERSRIARDIHDDLGASLTRITLLSQSGGGATDTPEGEALSQIHTTARHLMRGMEEVVWAVNPEYDTFDALANYLGNYGQGFLGVAGVRCRLELPMILPERPLSAQIRHNLFLAYKEALNNAVKYSGATEVRIALKPGDATFLLRVEDDGKGIDPDAPGDPMRPTSGSGLANMKSRMSEIGGTCTLESTLGKGTTVEFKVPFRTHQ